MSRLLHSTTKKFSRVGGSSIIRQLSGSEEVLSKTAFFDLHNELGGKMVSFAGYSLPVQYEGAGVLKEHLHTRAANSASLFDVSHMGQIRWHGKDAVKFIEEMVVGDIASLQAGQGKLSLIMNDAGGIVDDTVISNAGDHIYMVVNGGCKWKDMDHFKKYLSTTKLDVKMEYLADQQLLAIQGKGAAAVVARLTPNIDFKKMPFMNGAVATVAGIPNCRVTRCGYTGEDGFEISVDEKNAVQLAKVLLAQPEVKPCGLGARDSLRLEAGLCLYGNDIDETTSPVEAGLVWTMGGPASRRRKEQGYLGASHILKPDGALKPVTRKRVTIVGMKAPARAHTAIHTEDGSQVIGEVTSGGFGPTMGKAVAMGYVKTENAKGGPVSVAVRGKFIAAECFPVKSMIATDYFKV